MIGFENDGRHMLSLEGMHEGNIFLQRDVLYSIRFIQDLTRSHISNPAIPDLVRLLEKTTISLAGKCKFEWPPRFPDLSPANFYWADICNCMCSID